MAEHYDVIVLGCGGVGSSALWQLAKRGVRGLGIEQFRPAHDRGSSHGQTRIIRQAYFEHPDYVPLALRAYERWQELADESQSWLFELVGLLQIGPAEGAVIPGVLRAAEEHRLWVDSLTAAEIRERFPAFRPDENTVGLFESRAGFLHVERCVAAALDAARRRGAECHFHETVHSWSVRDSHVEVVTDRATYHTDRLIITAGAWAGQLLEGIGLRLQVLRKPQLWYRTTNDAFSVEAGCPTYLFETDDGIFYGFPQLDGYGVKVAEHTGGVPVTDPLKVDREVTPSDRTRVEAFAARYLSGVSRDCSRSSVCMYTMTADAHFVVDRHPKWPQVALAAGLSGHGFKFVPVLGEALVDLATVGSTSLPIEFLGLKRHLIPPDSMSS
jgi:monomeric sarcosine oxidase